MRKMGIYKIVCLKNNKSYIGSFSNLRVRKNAHFRLLRNGEHYNSHIQRAFDKYGES